MQNNEDLEKRVLEKLEQKIAVEKYKSENKQTKKKNNNILLKVASLVLVVGLISGNAYTFAKYDENMFSWVLKKIGIFEEYDEAKKSVGVKAVDNGVSLTLMDYGVDKDTLIVGYKLELEKPIQMARYLADSSYLECNDKIYNIDASSRTQIFDKVTDTEYNVYNFYKVDGEKIFNGSKFTTNVSLWKYDENDTDDDMIGSWDFEIELNTEDINLEYKEYEVKGDNSMKLELKDPNQNTDMYLIPELELLEVVQSKISTKFVFYLKMYRTEPGVHYYVEILDENGNVLLENNLEYLIGGTTSNVILGKVDLNSKLIINVYETESDGNISAQGTMEIELKESLQEKTDEKTSGEKETKNWRDISFEYPKESEITEEVYGYSLDDSKTYYIGFDLYKYYGNQKMRLDLISIDSYENIFDQDLKNLTADIRKIMKIGNYGLNYEYIVYTSSEDGEVTGEYVLSHEQMLELSDKEYLEIDGVKLTSQNVEFENTPITDIKEKRINNIDTISWIERDIRRYVFIHNGNVYNVCCPITIDQEEAVQEFLESIELH